MRWLGEFYPASPHRTTQRERGVVRQLGNPECVGVVDLYPGPGGEGDTVDLHGLVEREIVLRLRNLLENEAKRRPAANTKPQKPERRNNDQAAFEPGQAPSRSLRRMR
jgi:hypothetical protein